MGLISTIEYQGALRTSPKHIASGQEITTDAPVDNNGKGEAFSPTDLLATSLGACALTVMGIRANQEGFDLEDCTATVNKVMAADPRRVSEVHINVSLAANCQAKMQKILEGIGKNCPVSKSLHPDLKQIFNFEWK